MKQLNINLTALALGIAFSTGALAQLAGSRSVDSIDSIDSIEAVESDESVALLAAARKKAAAARLDVMYEAAKVQCNTYPVGSRAHCLIQMKAGFGK